MDMNERLILGIDPGFGRMGYAVVAATGNDLRLLVCDAIMTPTGEAYPLRFYPVSSAGGSHREAILRQECYNGHSGGTGSRCYSAGADSERVDYH